MTLTATTNRRLLNHSLGQRPSKDSAYVSDVRDAREKNKQTGTGKEKIKLEKVDLILPLKPLSPVKPLPPKRDSKAEEVDAFPLLSNTPINTPQIKPTLSPEKISGNNRRVVRNNIADASTAKHFSIRANSSQSRNESSAGAAAEIDRIIKIEESITEEEETLSTKNPRDE